MFFALALLSMLGYAIQGTFLVKYARRMDAFTLSMYRNLSLALTMLPLLLFVPIGEFGKLWENLPLLFGACTTGILGFAFGLVGQKSLPVGISSAFSGLRIILILLWGYFFFQETLTGLQAICIFLILSAVTFLAFRKNHMPHLDGKIWRGIFFSLLGVFFGSWAVFLISIASRNMAPLLAGYAWEVGIGLCAVLLVIGRRFWAHVPMETVSAREFRSIALISSWTLLGTGGFALAVNYGPVGILNAIGSAGIVVSTILSHALYQEKLSRLQWLAIGVVVIGVGGLRMSGV